jgi:MFS family permease
LLLAAQSTRWWHLYLAFGVIVAAGTAAAGWVPSVILIRAWFPAQIGTALGLASAGIGVGIFALVPFTQFMIERMGWRWTFRILAGVVVFWVVPATLWLVRDPDSGGPSGFGSEPRPVAAESEGHWTLRAALGAWRFWGTAAVFFSGNVATQMLLVHQVAYLVDHGVPALVAASVGGVVGLSSIAGKTGWGTLSDRVGRELAYTLSFACVVASLGVLALAGRYPASVLPYLYAALIGLGYAATGPLTPAVASDLFGGRRFSAIFGTLHIANSLGTASGAWVAGEIFDRTRSYAGALWLALAMAVLAPALLWIVAPRRPNPPPGSGEKAHAR